MKISFRFATLLLTTCLSACCHTGDRCERPAESDSGSKYTDISDKCEAACLKLSDLGCEEAKPTPAGVSCVDFCHASEAKGVVLLHPSCVAGPTVQVCADLPKCKQL